MSEARLFTFLSNFGHVCGHFFLFVYLFEVVWVSLYACFFLFFNRDIKSSQCIIIKYFNNLLNLYIYVIYACKKYVSYLNNVVAAISSSS